MPLIRNQKGFTLIELLLAILLLGILGVAALQSYFDSTGTFSFFAKEKELVNLIREARGNAINNRDCEAVAVTDEVAVTITGDKARIACNNSVVEFGDYSVKVLDSGGIALIGTVKLIYERGSGRFSVKSDEVLLNSAVDDRITIKIAGDGDLESEIVILKLAGLPEVTINP